MQYPFFLTTDYFYQDSLIFLEQYFLLKNKNFAYNSIKIKNKAGEASSLGQLGLLYQNNGLLEESAAFLRQACDISVVLKDMLGEGRKRSNLTNTLINLKRYDEAREEILKAIECDSHFGHAAQPWSTFSNLYNLETATENIEAANKAWQKAFDAYIHYRRDGGYWQSRSA